MSEPLRPSRPVNPDPRVRAALETAGLRFEVTESNDYRVSFTLDGGRKQRVFINSGTMTYGQLEVRCVWSASHRMTETVPEALANRLLRDNLKKKLGAWEIDAQPDGSFLICFNAKVPADLDPESLADVIDIVLVTSDKLEEELGSDDEY